MHESGTDNKTYMSVAEMVSEMEPSVIVKYIELVEHLLMRAESQRDELAEALRTCVEALRNVPFVGDVYDQQHSDTQLAADQIATSALLYADNSK